MNTLILRTVAHLLIPLQVVFSLFLLFRGHNDPGGGFSGALVLGSAVALHALAFTPDETRRRLRVEPVVFAGLGLMVAMLSGLIGMAAGREFLAGEWVSLDLVITHWEVGTPFLFDVGVYLLVIGMASAVLLGIMEER